MRLTSAGRCINKALNKQHTHQESVGLVGVASGGWLALVDTPVKITDGMHMPAAKTAMHKAWKQLWGDMYSPQQNRS